MRGRAETAAARRGLLATTRASEDAARGCRSAKHPQLLVICLLLPLKLKIYEWLYH